MSLRIPGWTPGLEGIEHAPDEIGDSRLAVAPRNFNRTAHIQSHHDLSPPRARGALILTRFPHWTCGSHVREQPLCHHPIAAIGQVHFVNEEHSIAQIGVLRLTQARQGPTQPFEKRRVVEVLHKGVRGGESPVTKQPVPRRRHGSAAPVGRCRGNWLRAGRRR